MQSSAGLLLTGVFVALFAVFIDVDLRQLVSWLISAPQLDNFMGVTTTPNIPGISAGHDVMTRPVDHARRFSKSHGSRGVGSGSASARDGSGRVGSGRVGSGRVGSGRVGSGRVGSGRVYFPMSRLGTGYPEQPDS